MKSLKKNFLLTAQLCMMFTKEADLTTEARFVLVFNVAKAKRLYIEGEFINKKIAQVVSILDTNNEKLQKTVEQMPASRYTLERRNSILSNL